MLGKTAGGLYWMFRYLERCEHTARLVDAGFRIALTRGSSESEEWSSLLETAGLRALYTQSHRNIESGDVARFLLAGPDNPSSVSNALDSARNNARLVRTALTRELWEAINDSWIHVCSRLKSNIRQSDIPGILAMVRQQTALVRGTFYGSMLRNEIFHFCQLGTFLERADNIIRILDVKYYILLPSVSLVGSNIDSVQWETILRAASAQRSFGWLYGGETRPADIADFLILDDRMPRSVSFCYANICEQLRALNKDVSGDGRAATLAEDTNRYLTQQSIASIIDGGLHEFNLKMLSKNHLLADAIETDYRFYE